MLVDLWAFLLDKVLHLFVGQAVNGFFETKVVRFDVVFMAHWLEFEVIDHAIKASGPEKMHLEGTQDVSWDPSLYVLFVSPWLE